MRIIKLSLKVISQIIINLLLSVFCIIGLVFGIVLHGFRSGIELWTIIFDKVDGWKV